MTKQHLHHPLDLLAVVQNTFMNQIWKIKSWTYMNITHQLEIIASHASHKLEFALYSFHPT